MVGVGGSAGGLEAFERLFAGMPPETGAAFVVIQHLDPTHKALMPELLQKATSLRVVVITDGITIEPNRIFVLPPAQDVSIREKRLWLSPMAAPHGARSPVDSFFVSLAADKGDKAIGIIVSGMGMDGTAGAKAIKEHGGALLVQDPTTAKYDGMPSSAISTGLSDYVALVEDMPAILVSYVQHASEPLKALETVAKAQSSLKKIIERLLTVTGHDFSLYKTGTLYRRIERRTSINHLDSIASYATYLEKNTNEARALFDDLFIGVTSFFRDPAAFDVLQEKVFPQLLKGKGQNDTIRIWCAGCSTGEEAYSIVMALQESIDKMPEGLSTRIQVFATDVDATSIDTARKGIYPETTVAGLSQERLDRFFTQTDTGYQVKKSIREAMVFAPHNIISAPPFTKLDMISCRNMMIYFGADLQNKLIPVFHYALNTDGVLFLGPSETISGYANLFYTIDGKWKLFRRKDYPAVWTGMVNLRSAPASHEQHAPGATPKEIRGSVPDIARHVILDEYAPAAVVIDESGDILYVSGRTGKYLELPAGKTTWNLAAMAREGLRFELTAAQHKASMEKAEVVVKGVSVITDAGNQVVNLTIRPFTEHEGLGGLLLVVFEDANLPNVTAEAGPAGETCKRCPELEQELRRTKQYLQGTVEDMQSAQEEMLSTNEEFESTNEELQSSNEELLTSKEELQSLNEELTTLNTEFQMKNEELTVVNNDMINLLNSTEIATIFLDTDLNIRRFTPSVSGILNLRKSDIGRPIREMATHLLYDDLVEDAQQVLDTLATKEAQVVTKDGIWFAMRMMPYRTLDNVIGGVVVTFSDISVPKAAEELLKKYEMLSTNSRDIILFVGKNGQVLEANDAATSNYGYSHDELLGLTILDLRAAPTAPGVKDEMLSADAEGTLFEAMHQRKDGSTFPVEVSSRGIDIGGQRILLSIIRDITERKRIEQLSDALNDINAAIRSTLDFDNMMETVLTDSVKAVGVESGSIALHQNGEWVVTYVYNSPTMPVGTRLRDKDIVLSAEAAATKVPLVVDDVLGDKDLRHSMQKKKGIRAFMAIPLVVRDEPNGVLWLSNHSGPFKFGEAETDFAAKLAASASLALENVRLFNEERDARSREETLRSKLQSQHSDMQQALLPSTIPTFAGCGIATRFVPGTPGEQIGGDFYDVFETEDNRIAILIGDVAGKGIEAAALATVTRSTVRAFAYELRAPGPALSHTNLVVSGQSFEGERFATVFLAILDRETGELTYSSAGHPPAMIVRTDGSVELLIVGSLPIRVESATKYESQESHLAPGDRLVMYTDGISEARSGEHLYDVDGIQSTLEKVHDSTPLEILDTLFSAAAAACEGKFSDDAAVIVVERSKAR